MNCNGVIILVVANKVRDEGRFWSAGDVLATVDNSASQRQKGAAAAAVALAYIDEGSASASTSSSSSVSSTPSTSSTSSTSSSKSLKGSFAEAPPVPSAKSMLDACMDESAGVFDPPTNPAEEIDFVTPYKSDIEQMKDEGWDIDKIHTECKSSIEGSMRTIYDDVAVVLDENGVEYSRSDIKDVIEEVYRKGRKNIPLPDEDREQLAYMFKLAGHIDENIDDVNTDESVYLVFMGSFNIVENNVPSAGFASGIGEKAGTEVVNRVESDDKRYISEYPGRDELNTVTFGDVEFLKLFKQGEYDDLTRVYGQYRDEVELPESSITEKLTLGNIIRGVVGSVLVLSSVRFW